MGIFINISRFDDNDDIDIAYILSLLRAQGIHFDQNKNLDMEDKRIINIANPQEDEDSVNLQYLIQKLQTYYKKTILIIPSTKRQIKFNFKTTSKGIKILI